MDTKLMRWLSALLLTITMALLAHAAPFGTSSIPPTGGPSTARIWEYCYPAAVSPCPAVAAAPAEPSSTVSSMVVSKWNAGGSFNSPPGGATQVLVNLYVPVGSSYIVDNISICKGGGTKAYDCSVTPTRLQKGGSNSFTVAAAPAGTAVPLDAATYTIDPSGPLQVMIDFRTNGTWNRPRVAPVAPPSDNMSPVVTAVANYNAFALNNVASNQACAQTKTSGYSSNGNFIWGVKSIFVQ